jgi:DNA replication protein DnaC
MMLNNETVEKLRYMKLHCMAETFRSYSADATIHNLSFEEWFGLLVDSEYARRKDALLQRLIKGASFKMPNACLEDIEYHSDRKLDKETLARLSTCAYISECRNVIVMGATGVGKTYVGCALGNAACRKFLKVKYARLPELLVDLSIARGDGSFRRVMSQYKKYRLLILDEWLLMPLDKQSALDVLEIIDMRHENSSTIFISQSAPGGWHSMLGEGRVADAILDRLIHNSYEILISGDSMRQKKSFKRKTGEKNS